jgi:microcystin-dependent protein
LNGDTLGATGGVETHTLLKAQLPTDLVTGTISAPVVTSRTSNIQEGGGTPQPAVIPSGGSASTTAVTAAAPTFTGGAMGSGSAHNNVQPTIISNMLIVVE